MDLEKRPTQAQGQAGSMVQVPWGQGNKCSLEGASRAPGPWPRGGAQPGAKVGPSDMGEAPPIEGKSSTAHK